MNRQKYLLKDTPKGYVHTDQSILDHVSTFTVSSLSYKMWAIYNDNTTLICEDIGNGNYRVDRIYGENTTRNK